MHPKELHSAIPRNALEQLLRRLHPDSSAAAEQYLRLRGKLVSYFEFERFPRADELADEVLDRVARRLHAGHDIEHPGAFALGVARLVAREARQQDIEAGRKLREFVRVSAVAGLDNDESALKCLDGCLDRLAPESRAFILAYYSGDRADRIENRRRLAGALGVQPAALRNRALRLRAHLEKCLKGCLGSGRPSGGPHQPE